MRPLCQPGECRTAPALPAPSAASPLQATTFLRDLPSTCSTQRPATPFPPGPGPSAWTAPQVCGSPDSRSDWVGVCMGQERLSAGAPRRPCRVHAARRDGAALRGQGLPALLLHQGPQQAGQLQRRPAQGKAHGGGAAQDVPDTSPRGPFPRAQRPPARPCPTEGPQHFVCWGPAPCQAQLSAGEGGAGKGPQSPPCGQGRGGRGAGRGQPGTGCGSQCRRPTRTAVPSYPAWPHGTVSPAQKRGFVGTQQGEPGRPHAGCLCPRG